MQATFALAALSHEGFGRSQLAGFARLNAGPVRFSAQYRRMTVKAAVKLSQDELKKAAAYKAVEYVKSGMKLGLGTGSTAAFAVDRIGDLLASGELKDIIAVPTSIRTYEQAKGIDSPVLVGPTGSRFSFSFSDVAHYPIVMHMLYEVILTCLLCQTDKVLKCSFE